MAHSSYIKMKLFKALQAKDSGYEKCFKNFEHLLSKTPMQTVLNRSDPTEGKSYQSLYFCLFKNQL